MPNIHELLDENQEKCEELTREIQKYKQARELSENASAAMRNMVELMEKVRGEIQPFTELKFRRFKRAVFALSITNTVLIILLAVILAHGIYGNQGSGEQQPVETEERNVVENNRD